MSTATTDPTLGALVPRGSAWRNVVLVVLALALLAAAWYLPPRLKPGIGHAPGGSWQEFAADEQVVLLAGIEPRMWGGTGIRAVEDVPGAHVVDAWAVDGDVWNGDPAATAAATTPPVSSSARDYVASLGVTDADRLPRTVAGDDHGEATIVVLWQIDDCAALSDGSVTIVVGNRLGVTARDSLPLPFSPFDAFAPVETAAATTTDATGPCGS